MFIIELLSAFIACISYPVFFVVVAKLHDDKGWFGGRDKPYILYAILAVGFLAYVIMLARYFN